MIDSIVPDLQIRSDSFDKFCDEVRFLDEHSNPSGPTCNTLQRKGAGDQERPRSPESLQNVR
jgi:hypothetical protein